jgi:hypothetical protein
MSDDSDFNTKELDALIKILSKNPPYTKVGILGSSNNRKEDANDNASIGLKHEFGNEGMPERSFLRVPIAEHFEKRMQDAGAFSAESFEAIKKERSFVGFMRKVGMIGVQIVQDAFDTGGFGKWKPSNMKYKKNHQTLVETQQLRNSIISQVVDK